MSNAAPDDLTDLLRRATEDATLRQHFLRTLLHSTVYFCASSNALADSTFEANGQTFRMQDDRAGLDFVELSGRNGPTIPFWTSLDELENDLHRLRLGEQPFMTLTGLEFLEEAQGHYVVLNPGTFAREFSPQQAESLMIRGREEIEAARNAEPEPEPEAEDDLEDYEDEDGEAEEVEDHVENPSQDDYFDEDEFNKFLREQQSIPLPSYSDTDYEDNLVDNEDHTDEDLLEEDILEEEEDPVEDEEYLEDEDEELEGDLEDGEDPYAASDDDEDVEGEDVEEEGFELDPDDPEVIVRANMFTNVPHAVAMIKLLLRGRSDEAWDYLYEAQEQGADEGLSKALALLLFTAVDGMGPDANREQSLRRLENISGFWNEWTEWVQNQPSLQRTDPETHAELSTQLCGCGHPATLHGRYSWPLRDVGIQTTSPCDSKFCICEGFFLESQED